MATQHLEVDCHPTAAVTLGTTTQPVTANNTSATASARDPSAVATHPPEASGLPRRRLLARLATARAAGLALVVAPAGYGKTTLLAQFAKAYEGPVVWRAAAELDLSDPDAVFRDAPPQPLLVIDNVDQIVDSPRESAFERLLSRRPRGACVLVGGRRMPALNLMRHEISEAPGLIGADELAFRPWEVARLLDRVYASPLPPVEVAALTRRTGGWPAGLAMFHLATRGRPIPARSRAATAVSGRWTAARSYFQRSLLADLDPAAVDFLVVTSVFELLTGERCDQLLGGSGSARLLGELASRFGVPVGVDGGSGYQCHPMLREHLAAMLDERSDVDGDELRAKGARLLVAEGAYQEAARGYARAGSLGELRELLATSGREIVESPDENLYDLVPRWLVNDDPWLSYGRARLSLGQGSIERAISEFQNAEAMFTSEADKLRCREDRLAARIWLPDGGEGVTPTSWASWLRAVVRQHPAAVGAEALDLPGAGGELVRLVSTLLTGQVRDAARDAALSAGGVSFESSVAALGLRLLRTALRVAQPPEEPAAGLHDYQGAELELESIAEEAEAAGSPWLGRMTRAVRALGTPRREPDSRSRRDSFATSPRHGYEPWDAREVLAECEWHGDRWGAVLALAVACLRDLRSDGVNKRDLARLASACQELDANVLHAWVAALRAITSGPAESQDAQREAHAAGSLALRCGAPGAHVLALVAQARSDRTRRRALLAEAMIKAEAIGLPLGAINGAVGEHGRLTPPITGTTATPPRVDLRGGLMERAPECPAISIRCFGGFRLEIDGRRIDLSAVRARARSALRLLAVHAGQVLHKEVLIEALWPGMAVPAATRNLQVTISALRGLLEPGGGRGKSRLLIRSGDAYGIALAPGSFSDTAAFRHAFDRWRRVRRTGGTGDEAIALRAALAAYPGDLLPEEGPSEWAVEARERFRVLAARVARSLARLELDLGDLSEAITAAEYCLTLDPVDDDAWRTLIQAYSEGDTPAKAIEARRRYSKMLESLGIPVANPEPRVTVPRGRCRVTRLNPDRHAHLSDGDQASRA